MYGTPGSFYRRPAFRKGSASGGGGGSSGPYITDPTLWPRYFGEGEIGAYETTNASFASVSTTVLNDGGVWGAQDLGTGWVAGSYRTILNVSSGRGVVSGMHTATPPSATSITWDVRITVDGVPYTITQAAVPAAKKLFIGALRDANTLPSGLSQSSAVTWRSDANGFKLNAGKTAALPSIAGLMLIVPPFAEYVTSTPFLKFEKSLLVEMRPGSAISYDAARSIANVFYRLL